MIVVRIPDDLHFRARDYAQRGPDIQNRFTMNGGCTVEDFFRSKLGEIAVRLAYGENVEEAFRDDKEKWDVVVEGFKIDVKATRSSYHNLIWPKSKNEDYSNRTFHFLMSVRIDDDDSTIAYIDGIISRELFYEKKQIAVEGQRPALWPGTWYMPKNQLYPLSGNNPKARIECLKKQAEKMELPSNQPFVGYDSEGHFVHYCQCGKWGAFGFNCFPLRGELGIWFCQKHAGELR
jgi:hypothetical protein